MFLFWQESTKSVILQYEFQRRPKVPPGTRVHIVLYLQQLRNMFLIALKLCTQRLRVSHGLGRGMWQPAKQPQWKQQHRQPLLSVWLVRTIFPNVELQMSFWASVLGGVTLRNGCNLSRFREDFSIGNNCEKGSNKFQTHPVDRRGPICKKRSRTSNICWAQMMAIIFRVAKSLMSAFQYCRSSSWILS